MSQFQVFLLVIVLSTIFIHPTYTRKNKNKTRTFVVEKRCCPERHGNIKKVLTYICDYFLGQFNKHNKTTDGEDQLIRNGEALAEYNNFWVECARIQKNLI